MTSQHEHPSSAFRTIKERLDELSTPVDLRVSVTNHVTHLEQLAERLKTFGMDDALIDRHIIDLFKNYETQLLYAMRAAAPLIPT
jgi:hypothetical protein